MNAEPARNDLEAALAAVVPDEEECAALQLQIDKIERSAYVLGYEKAKFEVMLTIARIKANQ